MKGLISMHRFEEIEWMDLWWEQTNTPGKRVLLIGDSISRDGYYRYVKEIFESPEAGIFFDQERLLGYLDEHYQGKAMRQRYIYTAMSLILWYREYFIKR